MKFKIYRDFFLNTTIYSGITLLVLEIILRTLSLGYNNSPINPSKISHHEHPKNFSFTAYSPNNEWTEFNIKTDEYGNREYKRSCIIGNKVTQKEYIFLGDSFVEGFQVSNKNSIVGRFEKEVCKIGGTVQNLGVSSYSPVLSFISFNHYIKRKNNLKPNLKNKVVVHYLADNDIDSDNKYIGMITLDNNREEIISAKKNLSPFQFINRISYLSRLVRRTQLTLKAINSDNYKLIKNHNRNINCELVSKNLSATKLYISKIDNLITKYGGKYILSAIPSDSRRVKRHNYKCYEKIAAELNIPFLEAPKELFEMPSRNYFDVDVHLNIQGNKLVANKLLKFIQKNNF